MSRTAVPIAVLLCEDLRDIGRGLALEELCRWLEAMDSSVTAKVVAGLCHTPAEVGREVARGAQRLVLGLCSSAYSGLEIQTQARKGGLDPLAIENMNLGAFCTRVGKGFRGTEKAKLSLAGAVAKVSAFQGSRPENLRPLFASLSQRVSRRALFTLPPLYYQAVACIDTARCAAGTGCALCVHACPRGALSPSGEGISIDRLRCDGCGLCVTACPRGAVQLPGSDAVQLQAQIDALLGTELPGLPDRRLLFACPRRIQAMEDAGGDGLGVSSSWFPVQVPCVGMVSAGWLLQLLAQGVTVGVAPCGPCPYGQEDVIRARVDYCRQLLGALGGPSDQVQLVGPSAGPGLEALPSGLEGARGLRREAEEPWAILGPRAAADAALELAKREGTGTALSLEHPSSPFGVLALDPRLCTGCGRCSVACPTGALAFERDQKGVGLSFDAALCTACGLCAHACPEARQEVLQVHRRTDLEQLARGRMVLYQDEDVKCVACGASIAPRAMLKRIGEMLGGEDARVSALVAQYCPSCRSPFLSTDGR